MGIWLALKTIGGITHLTGYALSPDQRTVAISGTGTFFQALPFQCKISVLVEVTFGSPASPTAQASLADAAVTPYRLPPPGRFGMGARFQVLPFHRAIRICEL